MDEGDWLAARFQAHRSHLRAVAYRMLGSLGEADDAVQDAWLRLSRSDTGSVQNLGGWLTTLVAVLDPDVVLRADRGAVPLGASRVVRGARAVAEGALTFARLGRFARPALVNGAAGVVARAPDGRPFSVMGFTVRKGKIVEIDILADPERLRQLDLALLND